MPLLKDDASTSSSSSYHSFSILNGGDLASRSSGSKRKCPLQETNNSSSLSDLSSYPNETNVCLHLSLYFCNCIQIAKKQKLAHQETNVDAVVLVGTSSDPWKIKKLAHQKTNVDAVVTDTVETSSDPWKIKKLAHQKTNANAVVTDTVGTSSDPWKIKKLAHQETNVDAVVLVGTSSDPWKIKKQKLVHQETNADAAVTDTVGTSFHSSISSDAAVTDTVGTSFHSSISSDDPWKIKKVLTTSDLENNSRLLLKKEVARKWVVPFVDKDKAEKDGVQLSVFDVDTQTLRSLVFKIWPSNNSHVFNNTWIKEFVDKRNLKAGDEIGFKWDQDNKRFDFSVLHRGVNN
ncbi:unnamed protein product [Lathyrus sativus]|nr:unnamed protein product [Lathyrus sativus]